MTLNGRLLTTLVMLAIFAGMSVMAIGYPAKARFLPLLVGIPGTVMCLAQLLMDLRQTLQERTGRAEVETGGPADLAREARMFLWLGIFFVGIMAFGFLYAAPVVVAAYLRIAERESWMTSILGGVGAWAILYVVFMQVLELFLFEGLITPLVLG